MDIFNLTMHSDFKLNGLFCIWYDDDTLAESCIYKNGKEVKVLYRNDQHDDSKLIITKK